MLKTIFWSGMYVIAGTMATAVAACVLWALWQLSGGADASLSFAQLTIGVQMTVLIGLFLGLLLSMVSLAVAALTMPPLIGLAHILKLPRPMVDIVGGAIAALPCPLIMISLSESLARSKGGGSIEDGFKLLLEVCALFGGGLLGYVRYTRLVKPRLDGEQPNLQNRLGGLA